MSDIFISYSKADHALALKLSAFLEAEGWTVWWDTSLGAADLYRDEIMKQLVSARAVIAIWTPNSVRSDWVRAEAGTAKKEGKLIPVKTPDVAYADIPLPFGEMHTENVGSTELIRAAIVAQLAKPVVEPSPWALLTKGFKYELLTWVGIVGGGLTLFANLSAVLKLADWARLLVQSWKDWTHAFWLWAFGWLGIHLDPEWTPVLSFLLFGSLLTIGQAIQFRRKIKAQPVVDKYQGNSFQLVSWRPFFSLICALIITIGALIALNELVVHVNPFGRLAEAVWEWCDNCGDQFYLQDRFMSVLIPLIISASVLLFARHRLQAVVALLLVGLFWTIITFNHVDHDSSAEILTAIIMLVVLPVILLSVAPAKAVSRRLIFLALGLLLLIALNELSKLGLDVTAPKLQG